VKILVTGASGFVGRHLCDWLAREGVAFRAAVRQEDGPWPGVPDDHVEVGPLGPDTRWQAALGGVTAVVHLAARVHVMADRGSDAEAAYERANVDGTRRLLELAAEAGARRFVFVSTVKVHGETSGPRGFRFSDAPAPQDAYSRSKWRAEQLVRSLADQRGLEWVVVRPTVVYGPRVRANILTLLKAVDRGIPLPLGAVHNRRSFLYVGNLAAALHRCAVHESAPGNTFLLDDGRPVSVVTLIEAMARQLGRRARLLPVPPRWLRRAARLVGREEMVRRLVDDLWVDSSPAESTLGFTPEYSLSDGLRATAAWYGSAARG